MSAHCVHMMNLPQTAKQRAAGNLNDVALISKCWEGEKLYGSFLILILIKQLWLGGWLHHHIYIVGLLGGFRAEWVASLFAALWHIAEAIM